MRITAITSNSKLQRAATEYVKVKMRDFLASVGSIIRHDPVSALRDVLDPGNLVAQQQTVGEQFPVVCRYIMQSRYVFFRNDERMDRGFRGNVVESDRVIVLGQSARRYLSPYNFAKDAVVHHAPLSESLIVRTTLRPGKSYQPRCLNCLKLKPFADHYCPCS